MLSQQVHIAFIGIKLSFSLLGVYEVYEPIRMRYIFVEF